MLLKLLVLQFFFSIIGLSLDCESLFVRSYVDKRSSIVDIKLFKNQQSKLNPKLNSKLQKLQDELDNELEDIDDFVQDLLEGRLNSSLVSDDIVRVEIGSLIKEMNPRFKKLYKKIQKDAQRIGLPLVVKRKKSYYGVYYYYMEFNPSSVDNNFQMAKKLTRIMKRQALKKITFDPMMNKIEGIGGFYRSQEQQLELGIQGLLHILDRKNMSMVVKHEVTHGAFNVKRKRRISSVFHSSYSSSLKGKKIYDDLSLYTEYMSAEELYTFANNPLWGADSFLDLSKLTKDELISDFYLISDNLISASEVADQTKRLTEDVIQYFEKMLKKKSLPNLEFINEAKDIARSSVSAKYVSFSDKELGFNFFEWTKDKRIEKDLSALFQIRRKLEREFTQGVITKRQAKLRESKLGDVHIRNIIKYALENQRKLNTYAVEVGERVAKLRKTQDRFTQKVIRPLRSGELSKDDRRIEDLFKELHQKYRELALTTREDYRVLK